MALAEHPEDVRRLTIKGNTVAVVTDGSAVLGPRRHRPGRRDAGHGGQGRAVQAVRRHRRLADLPGHPGRRRDRAHRRAHRPRLRRHQPRGHRRAALLRDRGPAAREARHPGLPRRPARDGDRRARRAAATRCAWWTSSWTTCKIVVAGGGAAGTAIVHLLLKAGAGRCWCGTARASSPRTTTGSARRSRTWRGAPTPAACAASCPTRSTAPTSSSGSARATCSPVEDLARMNERAVVFPMANPTPEVDPVRARQYAADRRVGPLGPAEPDQQRAGVPRGLPRAARRAGHRDQRRHAARRGRRAGRRRPRRPAQRQLHHPERLRPRRHRRRWPPRSPSRRAPSPAPPRRSSGVTA